ncbi:RagB/SusD family nutrient uptake outer membrane protein [Flagellimonas pelagia]|uniref:RagB/SusD family nutrient uptake outer membrane protein n=1 Tax=Flagellimonas pelagia TaxID=2306998 RepID=A0A3A1NGL1_9FLAO|nr:RagB/SusD family nutrient uptake outer membrane protein [Allomuricauda maritima]RIV43613.1 RagB/SusD family nutrient uptake outer membrane protein [Allomuricauda maritima]TXJ93230.1 RagB/SusD family nutrient uptake outer membrane protein [Allomuricauda maritima]
MKNKLYTYGLLLFTSATLLVSCDDELNDLQPFTEGNPETFFNSVSSFQNGVDGIYSQFWNYYSSPGSGLQGIPDILSDNVVLAQTGRRSNEVYYDFRYNPNTGGAISLYWSEAYEAVNAANLIIGQIDNLTDGPEKDNILGQALAARAIAHFDLVRIFGKIPTQSADANDSPGIVYVKVEDGDTGDPFAQPARETVASNYAEIIGDLEAASQLIADSNGEGRLDRDAVYGMLSRVYLYNGEYQKVINAANEVTTAVVDANEAGALLDVYEDTDNDGVIMEWSVNTSSESGFNNVGVLYSQTTPPNTVLEYAVEYDFFNNLDANDLRREVIQYDATNQGNSYNAIRKFLGETGQVNGRVDIKVLRAAEVLLNKAEAQFELNQPGNALATLDLLRAKRYSSFTGGESGQALEDAIQYERRVELCFEGHRFFDIKRRGESMVRSNNGDLQDGTGTPAEVLTLPAGDYRFQFPIPTAEINANPNMVQNPNY